MDGWICGAAVDEAKIISGAKESSQFPIAEGKGDLKKRKKRKKKIKKRALQGSGLRFCVPLAAVYRWTLRTFRIVMYLASMYHP